MEFFLEILIVCLLFFLYWIFVLAKDDFILLRKNVTLEHLFNLTFLTLIISIIFARIFYVLSHLNPKYLDPLVLILFPYFPGLSLAGGLMGGISFIAFRSLKRKIPFGRILDIFSLSFFFVFCIGYLLVQLVNLIISRHFSLLNFSHLLFFILLFFFSFWLFAKNKLQDGSMGYICFALFSLIEAGFIFFEKTKKISFITPDFIVYIIFMATFLVLLIRQEKILTRLFRKR